MTRLATLPEKFVRCVARGKRFLLNRDSEAVREAPTFAILNWTSLPALR
jgi:hypothetical protein